MARGAVKAKQAQAQKRGAQAAKTAPRRARGRRGHAGGGNPNQQLFFMRLRRQAKLMYVLLAVLFAANSITHGKQTAYRPRLNAKSH
jgi:hypothetical protein